MKDITLYRKYRPKDFNDVIGQDHVVKVLKGAIKNGSISHAYLFSGSRGIGKTSVARIFAHSIGTSDNDIHELDAASNRKIEHVREIRDAVAILPLESTYKVYIFDEVHMLVPEAFNALLKTLEEPPAHVIFILATTEADRVPDTIISRCQTFQFKRPNQKTLQKSIEDIARHEGYELEDSASSLIALLADGSFRDALGVLQKVLSTRSTKKKTISVEEVEEITGAPRTHVVHQYVEAIARKDCQKGIDAVNEVVKVNGDMRIFAQLVIERVRQILLLRFAPNQREMIEEKVSDDDMKFLLTLAGDKEVNINSHVLDMVLEAYGNMKYAYLPQIPLELVMIKLDGDKD